MGDARTLSVCAGVAHSHFNPASFLQKPGVGGYDFLVGAAFVLVVEAVLAAEQQASPSLPCLAQHSAFPSFMEEQASPAPQQPLPSLLLQVMPASEHLQPSALCRSGHW